MSLIGSSCMILPVSGQTLAPWKMATIRAATQPLHPNCDLNQIRVLVEWCDGVAVLGDTNREWVNLTNPEAFKSVYVEKKLLWARRVLPSEQNRAVAWPARSFVFLCGTPILPSMDMMIVEYFCDKERTQLHVQETKELQLSEAKASLAEQSQMLQELNEWEEGSRSREMVQSCSTMLNGCRISVCNIQQPHAWICGVITSHNPQTKELTLIEDHTQSLHTINPLMVHAVIHTPPDNGRGTAPPPGNQNGAWQAPAPLMTSPDMSSTNSPAPMSSPHITSPNIQECVSPQFNLNLNAPASSTTSKSPLSLYQSPSRDSAPPHPGPFQSLRRSSLQQGAASPLMRSEPNLHRPRRSSLDPATLHHLADPFSAGGAGCFQLNQLAHMSHSLGKIPFHASDGGGVALHSSPHGSNSQLSRHGSNPQLNSAHGSNSQLSQHGSNSQLSVHGGSSSKLSHHDSDSSLCGDLHSSFPTNYPTPEDIIKQTDRSKSLGNIFSCVQTQPLDQCYQRYHEPEDPAPLNTGGGVGGEGASNPLMLHPGAGGRLGGPGLGVGGAGAAASGGGGGTALQNSQKRRKNFSYGSGGLGRNALKKPRFDVLPTICDPHDPSNKPGDGLEGLASAVSKTLCRSASQPAVFPPNRLLEKRLKQLGRGAGNLLGAGGAHKHEDDLDIIKQIIETDVAMTSVNSREEDGLSGSGGSLKTQSLTHLPGQFPHFAGSLPSLHRGQSMHVIHANYNSEPNFQRMHNTFVDTSQTSLLSVGGSRGSVSGDNSAGDGSLFGPSGDFQLNSTEAGFMGQDGLLGLQGAGKGLDQRRNSLYEGQSASSNMQDPLQDAAGSSFDFPHPRILQVSGGVKTEGNSTSMGAGSFDTGERWNQQSTSTPNLPNTYQYTPSSTPVSNGGLEPLPPPSEDSTGLLAGPRRQSSSDNPSGGLLYDYLTGGAGQGEEMKKVVVKQEGVKFKNAATKSVPSLPDVATEAVVLAPSVPPGQEQDGSSVVDLAEFSISRVINRQFSGEEMDAEELLYNMDSQTTPLLSPQSPSPLGPLPPVTGKAGKPKKPKKAPQVKESTRSRGRPRLTEEEKQRRKELRELGLMKRSKRRTKEQVAQWKAEKTLTPAKRGRKPGSGKKNIVKTPNGKVVFVSLDLSQYSMGTILLQNGFCRAYPGVSRCLDCSTCDGDFPSSKYCRFLEFRKLCVEDSIEPRVSVHGFADYTDAVAQDLVPWTPLKTNFSGMDEETALFILRRIVSHFMAVVLEEAKTLPEDDVLPVWKCAVSGVRELCDTCATSLFNFHWFCRSCGFCICPACYNLVYTAEDKAVSSMQAAAWPPCVSNNQPHQPSGLILAQIIPANVLSEVLSQVISICAAHKIQVKVPGPVQRMMSLLSLQVPQTKFQNEPCKKSKTQSVTTPTIHTQFPPHLGSDSAHTTPPPQSLLGGGCGSNSTPPSSASSSSASLLPSLSSYPALTTGGPNNTTLPNTSTTLREVMELPHSCSNGHEDVAEPGPIQCPHQWLCDGTLLCLLDARHSANITAFQERWKRGEPVVVAGVDRFLDKNLWTPQAFERDFGDEPADLVDCRLGLHLLQLPTKTFWAGFEDMSVRLRDPNNNEPRLLKLKDWPTADEFSEKLPRRYKDLMDALPLQEYTRQDSRFNMVSSLPGFFVKPDLGPKMYNAYGSPKYPSCGTTNLHLDISSAVNVMVYCSVPPSQAELEWRLVEGAVAAECCPDTVARIKDTGAKVGAIWHLYSSSDADKIRALLKKVYEETGLRSQVGSDPIHDQLVYLDSDLRQRLYREYGVKGWAIAQCVGDAIFIPAGAPHQVRNLCSCIKVAEDFVSPEHVYECMKLTEEFRQLSERHANHEDKLQMKNIIYHSMKDVVGALKTTAK